MKCEPVIVCVCCGKVYRASKCPDDCRHCGSYLIVCRNIDGDIVYNNFNVNLTLGRRTLFGWRPLTSEERRKTGEFKYEC